MALYKLHDFDPNYRDHFNGDDVKGLEVYSQTSDEKIGTVSDALVDEQGQFRYLIIDTGFWVFGKKVILPVGMSRIDYSSHRVYASLTKDQVENLPAFTDDLKIDNTYEDQVRGVYRPGRSTVASTTSTADASAPLDTSSSLYTTDAGVGATGTTRQDMYAYDQDPAMYNLNDRDHQTLRLYEERLIANKQRMKTGEVAVGKRVETETQRVSVPVEKERVIVERTTPSDVGTAVTPGEATFQNAEVARMEVYEEVADIRREPFVREEVQVRKEVTQEQVDREEQVRREELDINTNGDPIMDKRV